MYRYFNVGLPAHGTRAANVKSLAIKNKTNLNVLNKTVFIQLFFTLYYLSELLSTFLSTQLNVTWYF